MLFPAKKSLGQHFLHHPGTLDKIFSLAKVSSEDHVLEIGPGPGGLTERMAAKANQVVAIEKDRRFVEELKMNFQNQDHVTIIEGDILKVNLQDQVLSLRKGFVDGLNRRQKPFLVPPDLVSLSWKVVANLPYNIATEIIFRLLEHRAQIREMYLMVQKEVAERLVASPGSKDYGVLSIMSQLYSENKIVMKLAPGAFFPPPKVHSAVVSFQVSDSCRYNIQDHTLFSKIVRMCFSQRRKMILNPLRTLFPAFTLKQLEERLKKADIPPSERPENVSIEKFSRLTHYL